MGDPNVATPHLDRLAAEGSHFPSALSGTPLCTPARGSFLTSRYPHNSTAPTHDSPFDSAQPTIATVMKSEGYETCFIGKWHLDGRDRGDDTDDTHIEARTRIIPAGRRGGFERWFGFEFSNRPFDTWINVDEDGRTVVKKLDGYQTDALTDLLLDWVDDRAAADNPFFAVLSVEPPHNPYIAPADSTRGHSAANVVFRPNVPNVRTVRDIAGPELAGYYASIERIDDNVGRIREYLRVSGLAESTYIFFFSDHGDMHGSHGQFRKTAPWEEAIRVPMIVGGPSREHQELAYSSIDSLVNHVDVAPTTLGLCGIGVPSWMEGYDYSRRLIDENWHDVEAPDDEPTSAYLSLPIATGHENSVDREYRGIVTKDGWKYVCLEGQPWLMFDLRDDPYEQVNLALNPRWAAERSRLQQILTEWIRSTGDTFALPDVG